MNSKALWYLVPLAVGLFLALLFTYGFLPGMVTSLDIQYYLAGSIECLNNLGWKAFFSYCQNSGGPNGAPFVMGLPYYYIGFFVSNLFSLNAYFSSVITSALFIAVAYLSCIKLLCFFLVRKWVSVVMAFFYLNLPMIYGFWGFATMLHGFALIPFYILVDLLLIRKFEKKPSFSSLYIVLLVVVFVKSFALFLDGYSFLISNLASFSLLFSFLLHKKARNKNGILLLAFFVFANLVAFLLYNLYVPMASGYLIENMDVFRAMGTDLHTLFSPAFGWFYFLDYFGLSGYLNSVKLYGDPPSFTFNYLGYSYLVGFVLFVFIYGKISKQKYVLPLVIAGFISLILSFGSVIKYDLHVEFPPNEGYSYYLQEGIASIDLPFEFIYQYVPGINNMRATYRWIILFKLVLVVCLALVITEFLRRRNWLLVFCLLTVMIVELIPNYPYLFHWYTEQYDKFKLLQDEVIVDLEDTLTEGEKVFFLTQDNDFSINYIAAKTGIYAYNSGQDKTFLIAHQSWPEGIKRMRAHQATHENAISSFVNEWVDVIIIPFFGAQYADISMGINDSYKQEQLSHFDLEDPRLVYQEKQWFGVLRLSSIVD